MVSIVLLPLHLHMYCDAAQSVLGKKKRDHLHDTVKTAQIHAFTVKNKEILVLQLSNEMQLSIMNKVKSGELSIEDALNQARRDQQQLLSLKNQNDEVKDSLKKCCSLKFLTCFTRRNVAPLSIWTLVSEVNHNG